MAKTNSANNSEEQAVTEHLPIGWKWQHIATWIAIIVAVIFGITGIYTRWGNERLNIDVELITIAPIVNIPDEGESILKLLFQEEEVQFASIYSFLVSNTGNVDAILIDRDKINNILNPRIRIEFDDRTRVLDAQYHPVGSDKSSKFQLLPSQDSNNVTFLIELLNSNSSVQVDVFVAENKAPEIMAVESLGKGVSGIYAVRMNRMKWNFKFVVMTVVLVIGCLLSLVHMHKYSEKDDKLAFLAAMVILMGFIMCLVFTINPGNAAVETIFMR